MSHRQTTKATTITSTTLQQHYGNTIRRIYKGKEHLIVERDGLPVMVILPVADYEELIGAGPARRDGSPRLTAR